MLAHELSIPRSALHEQVADRLRVMLVEGGIPPGAKLNERELAGVLRVSRTPLREAIKLLGAEGLVELVPNRGATAVRLGEADVRHTFEAMAGLEALSGELAAQRITDAELAAIEALQAQMRVAFGQRDLSAYYRLNAQIHQAINAAAKNPVLGTLYGQLNARLQALRYRSNLDEAKWSRAAQEHEQMIEALRARDGPRMRDLLTSHLNLKRDVVLAKFAQQGDAAARQA
ncbi:GntR family transcriptional regulator [Ramlibacter sp. AN1133]|uniref:GntR family transcriptional regulator n=1 Tax=Ramlibacter sp. AN1133 TaxID=3133429 RepID=UPI0030BF42DF